MTPQENSIPFGFCHCNCGGKAPIASRTHTQWGHVKGQPIRFIVGHWARLGSGRKSPTPYVLKDQGYKTPCWVWLWSIDRGGYGRVRSEDRIQGAHAVYWKKRNGPVPEGLELDHLCHDPETCKGGRTCPHRRCINPDHLEPVTTIENIQRGCHVKKVSCPRGHVYSFMKSGRRFCKICANASAKEYMRKKRAKIA